MGCNLFVIVAIPIINYEVISHPSYKLFISPLLAVQYLLNAYLSIYTPYWIEGNFYFFLFIEFSCCHMISPIMSNSLLEKFYFFESHLLYYFNVL